MFRWVLPWLWGSSIPAAPAGPSWAHAELVWPHRVFRHRVRAIRVEEGSVFDDNPYLDTFRVL